MPEGDARQPEWEDPTGTRREDPWAPPAPWQAGVAVPVPGQPGAHFDGQPGAHFDGRPGAEAGVESGAQPAGQPGAQPGGPIGAYGGPAAPPAGWRPLPLPPPPRPAWPPTRREVLGGFAVVLALAAVGVAVALLWWQIAPRLGFRVTSPGSAVPIAPEQEQFFGADAWFTLLTVAVGLLAGALGWWVRSLRGPAMLVGLGIGGLAGAAVAWRVGLLLAPVPSSADLAQVGRVVYPALRLRATAALFAEPFVAVFVYLLHVCLSPRQDLGRPDDRPAAAQPDGTPQQYLPPQPGYPPY